MNQLLPDLVLDQYKTLELDLTQERLNQLLPVLVLDQYKTLELDLRQERLNQLLPVFDLDQFILNLEHELRQERGRGGRRGG